VPSLQVGLIYFLFFIHYVFEYINMTAYLDYPNIFTLFVRFGIQFSAVIIVYHVCL